MTTLSERIAAELVERIAKRVNLTIAERERIASEIVAAYDPVVVRQEPLHFLSADDERANSDQRKVILELLQARRSAGATNAELSEIALKYTGRISELRRQPYNYRIKAVRESGRTFRYFLDPSDWQVGGIA